jgi:hypothetical protein
MADDVDAPHDDSIEVADSTVSMIAHSIVSNQYLAKIAGGKATWILRTKVNGEPLAVIAQQWASPRLLDAAPKNAVPNRQTGKLQVYVEYYCQADPNLVYAALQGGQPLPDRYSG